MATSERSDNKHLLHLKLFLTFLVAGAWIAHLLVDESMMAAISGATPPDLDYWDTKGAGFALIAAVGIFVSLIPPPKSGDLAPKAVGALAALSSGYCWLEGSTGGNIGGYVVVVGLSGVIIGIGLLAGPALAVFSNAGGPLMARVGQAVTGRVESLVEVAMPALRERRERQEESSND